MNRPYRIVITTGDFDGVGAEIASKALDRIGPRKGVQFFVWRSSQIPQRDLKRFSRNFNVHKVLSWPQALQESDGNSKTLIDIESNMSPALWIEHSAQAGLFGHIDAIVTGPLSKTEIRNAQLKDRGHTDILRRICEKDLFMSFVGDEFSTILLTDHCAISDVEPLITKPNLKQAIQHALHLHDLLPKKFAKRAIGVLGLNPHAGEDGIIGTTEKEIHLPVVKTFSKSKVPVVGPLIPDVAYQAQERDKYSVFIANYHDQGLIPFKSIHKRHSGAHITLGLPFVRTSVDHGTAKDLFGKNKADYSSMVEALNWALKLIKKV
ncbi:MAG: 4-hydroxythreonine-4-phosphate dehydrogenase PdxA [Bdellovibrionales bacterium]|nr:4-hydroxythreonine-4-phosphate dehydrogenase PdxA [Bdellovibrionales bacterium]